MKFDPNKMRVKYGNGDTYATQPPKKRGPWTTPRFFLNTLFGPLAWLWLKARRNQLDDIAWTWASAWLAEIFEDTGCTIHVEGMANLRNVDGPCVFIGNHMSTLETFVLPGIIRPVMPVTFVVKKSLITMPVFGPIMRSRNPVVVERANPRQDLATVLEEGTARLRSGISIIVFPQHTRSLEFDPGKFNSIGIKLALKSGSMVVPLALKTDAWGQGKKIKELGPIRPEMPTFFRFGKPITVTGRGREEQAEVCDFIQKSLKEWEK